METMDIGTILIDDHIMDMAMDVHTPIHAQLPYQCHCLDLSLSLSRFPSLNLSQFPSLSHSLNLPLPLLLPLSALQAELVSVTKTKG